MILYRDCEHGWIENGGEGDHPNRCFGPVEVEVDYEAAGDLLSILAGNPHQDDELSLNPRQGARMVVDAALPGGDE